MRDPNRIRPFLDKLADGWEKCPDLRFGQLVMDIVPDSRELWNCEENKFLEKLDEFMSDVSGNSNSKEDDKPFQAVMTKRINPFNKVSRKIRCIENTHDFLGDGNYKIEKELEVGKEYTFMPRCGGRSIGTFIHIKELPNRFGYPEYLFEELEPYDEDILREDAKYHLFKELEKSREDYKAGRYSLGREVLERIKKRINEGSKATSPQRISDYIDVIEKAWNKYPNLSLGQLIQYALEDNDVWNVEDEALIESFKEL